jgi:ABC-type multidrug transport system fused ATPase/permease subunit
MISFSLTIKASRKLHDEMAKAVLRAKISFFDTRNPLLGHVLNRFSADVGSNDDMLPQTLSGLFQQQSWFKIDPSILTLFLSMLLQSTGMFQWCIHQSAKLVNQMVSVELVPGFGKLEPEAPLELESDKGLDTSWPNHGAVEVQDLAVRYQPALPHALDGVSFSFPSGSRVGIVGRTGSEKSTIVQTLFPLLEAESGSIFIDGVDILGIGLH